ncbi:hypothetical protein VTI74DRAFT_10249 [Chaetomium olivicolor]
MCLVIEFICPFCYAPSGESVRCCPRGPDQPICEEPVRLARVMTAQQMAGWFCASHYCIYGTTTRDIANAELENIWQAMGGDRPLSSLVPVAFGLSSDNDNIPPTKDGGLSTDTSMHNTHSGSDEDEKDTTNKPVESDIADKPTGVETPNVGGNQGNQSNQLGEEDLAPFPFTDEDKQRVRKLFEEIKRIYPNPADGGPKVWLREEKELLLLLREYQIPYATISKIFLQHRTYDALETRTYALRKTGKK